MPEHYRTRPHASQLGPYLTLMQPFTLWLGLGVLFSLVTLLSSIGMIALSGWFLSASALAGLSVGTAATFNYFLPSAGIRLCVLTRTAGRYGERLTSHEGTLRLLSQLRRHIYETIEPLSPAALQRHGSGELLTRLTADIDALDSLYLRVLAPSLVALLAIIGCGVVIGVFSPGIGLFAATALLLSGLIGPWLAWRLGHRHTAQWQALNGRLRAQLTERLAGLPELVLYGRWEAEADTLDHGQCQRDAEECHMARLWGLSQWLSQTLLGLTLSATLAMAAWLATHDSLDPTLVALMGLTVLAAYEAIALLPQAWQNLGRIQHAARRLESVGNHVPTITFPRHDRARPRDASLVIDDLHVAFADGTQALHGVTLKVESGEHLALLGPSGSGKTTLLDALVRFVEPQCGNLRLGQVALHDLSEDTLRESFAVAPQDIHLFVASYRENLALASPEASDEEMIDLLTALGLGDWLKEQPAGLDGYPEEDGSSLSGGQLRRFGVARALLSPAPVLLLDEPTEGLDETTAARVLDEIDRCCRGRTLLLVTHHPAGLDRLDRVAILDAGRVQEVDTPQP
ncbi:thiol reductant ABC exporter subunit CydC [Chromohalobacter israelensis]|uniref:thiol reductant ABC exporter subunit CydC n=1 Tax=Chromohalobacter israelensis TaxID=141390 RepID=UPI0013E8C84C|nr:thiol reductant ABC exporter subunit CydC [Chromohalobacter salexigens]